MVGTFKDRDEHRGKPAPHLGKDHYEKSRIAAGAARDSGPTFAAGDEAGGYHEQPQQPADATYRTRKAIEKGSEPNRDKRSKALEEAVKDLDDGLSVKPD